jgi:tartrate dehydratase beta subunit/fumarate hydratase class I family protein
MRVRYREVTTWPVEALTWQLQVPELTATVVDDTHGRDMPLLRTR